MFIGAVMSWVFSRRWLIVGALYVISLGGVFLWTWNWRDDVCEAAIESANVEAQNNSLKGANDVRKKEQTITHKRVIAELDRLGILRPSEGQ